MCNPGTAAGPRSGTARAFLLSPASLAGVRGRRLLSGVTSAAGLAPLLSGGSVPLGDVYTSISSLYFRGKLAYARRFARGPGERAIRAITSNRGLLPVDEPVSLDELRAMAADDIGPAEERYVRALVATSRALRAALPADAEVVLLGSIATAKYVEPLSQVFGQHLLVPTSFVGRGDMSRGGLLLRAVEAGEELDYEVALTVARRGPKPPRLR